MSVWLYSVTGNNWPVLKERLVWAVSDYNRTKPLSEGDILIFYVKGTGEFRGIYRIVSDWHEPTVTWNEGSDWKYEIDLETIQEGRAVVKKLVNNLAFIAKKKYYSAYLRGHTKGPSNSGRPIDESDYKTILNALRDSVAISGKPKYTTNYHPDVNRFAVRPSDEHLKSIMYSLDNSKHITVKHIVERIDQGKYAIPIFQRDYTWKLRQIEELWESIFSGFYIGSILTWKDTGQMGKKPVSGGPQLDDPSELILDGQQRITSLYYAVSDPKNWAPNDKRVLFFVDLNALLNPNSDPSDVIIAEPAQSAATKYPDDTAQFQKKIMPLTKLKDEKYIDWLTRFLSYLNTEMSGTEASKYHTQLMRICNHVWHQYQIPVVKLPKSLTLDRVAEVFERINSKGTRLSVFDLLNARFTRHKISLAKLLEDTLDKHQFIKQLESSEKYILQALCLYKTDNMNRKMILSLDDQYTIHPKFQKESFEKDWDGICQAINDTVKTLRSHRPNGFGAVKMSMIPSTVTIPVMAALLYKIETDDSLNDRISYSSKIRQWYWSVVTSDHYSGSSNTNAAKDYKEMCRWFNRGSAPEIVQEQRSNLDKLTFNSTSRNDVIYKTILCLVAKNGAHDFVDGTYPEDNELDVHHIFPKSKGQQYKGDTSIDSILNKTLLKSETNRNYIRDKSPSEYILSLFERSTEKKVRAQLNTHLISREGVDYMKEDKFAEFVNTRRETIRGQIRKLINDDDNQTDAYVAGLLHREESMHLEYKSSLQWNIKERRVDRNLRIEVIKEISAFVNTRGGKLLIGVNDDGTPIGIQNDIKYIGSNDKFKQLIASLITKHLGGHINTLLDIDFPVAENNKKICVLDIKSSPTPVYFNDNDFFIRTNSGKQLLPTPKALEYIKKFSKKE